MSLSVSKKNRTDLGYDYSMMIPFLFIYLSIYLSI